MDNIWEEPSEDIFCKVVDVRVEKREFETDDGLQERDYVVVEVEDLVHDLEFNRTFTFPVSTHPRSKWGIFKKDLKRIGHPVKTNGDFVGHCFHFRIKDLDLGRGFVIGNYPEPVRHFSSEEECIAAAKGETTPAPAPSEQKTPASILALVEALNGKTWAEAVTDVFSNEVVKNDASLVAQLVDEGKRKALMDDLVSQGLLQVKGDKFVKA